MHIAKININNETTDVAIKILRPDIEKKFNDELNALMLFAYVVESFFVKTKRLKLVEVVLLLREITNIEMDLRFEARWQSKRCKRHKRMSVLKFQKYIGITLQKEY